MAGKVSSSGSWQHALQQHHWRRRPVRASTQASGRCCGQQLPAHASRLRWTPSKQVCVQREDEYLAELGWSEQDIQRISSYVPDPVSKGATSKYSVEVGEES